MNANNINLRLIDIIWLVGKLVMWLRMVYEDNLIANGYN